MKPSLSVTVVDRPGAPQRKAVRLSDFSRVLQEAYDKAFVTDENKGRVAFKKGKAGSFYMVLRLTKGNPFSEQGDLLDTLTDDALVLAIVAQINDSLMDPEIVVRMNCTPLMNVDELQELYKALGHVGMIAKHLKLAFKDTFVTA